MVQRFDLAIVGGSFAGLACARSAALHYDRRAAVLVADHLGHRGPHPVKVMTCEAPRYTAKLAMRRLLDLAPPNALINAALMTAPMRRLAQRLYFHARGESAESFETWSQAFEHGEAETAKLKLV